MPGMATSFRLGDRGTPSNSKQYARSRAVARKDTR